MDCPRKSPTFTKKINSLDTDCFYHQDNGRHVGYCNHVEFYRCIEDVWKKPLLLSFTGLNSFLTCHHLYYLKYIRGIEIRKPYLSNALKLGILWDSCLQFMFGETGIDLNALIAEYEMGEREVAKVRGLYRAFKALEIKIDMNCSLQSSFFYNMDVKATDTENDIVTVNGKYDRKYIDGFVETKLSGRPDNYADMFFIQSQVATYFAVDPSLKWVTMEINRTPDLKSTGMHKEEDAQMYEERVFQDVISRPSWYFIGWNKDTHTYGKTYYRNEFDLDEVMNRYKHTAREIMWAAYHDGWYKNDRVCSNILPGISCEMLPVCRHNVLNEQVFKIKEAPMPKTAKPPQEKKTRAKKVKV